MTGDELVIVEHRIAGLTKRIAQQRALITQCAAYGFDVTELWELLHLIYGNLNIAREHRRTILHNRGISP